MGDHATGLAIDGAMQYRICNKWGGAMSNDILAKLDPTGPRRYVGVGMLLVLGGLLLYLAFVQPPASLGWQALLIGLGLFALWLSHRMLLATTRQLFLTRDALIDSEGRVLVRVDEIEAIDRGMFALKPSNGFMLRLKNPAPREWHPGLWWRIGRRLAVGGVTPGSQSRPMADIISMMIAERT